MPRTPARSSEGTLPLFTPQDKPLLMLIDGHAMVHRSFHAISVQRHLSVSATGEDVTGVYGFTNVFLRSLQDWRPTYCAIAFDTSVPTFRHQQFEQYKAQRAAAPPELRPQFDRVKQLMQAFGVPIFAVEGYEADDIIGTLASQAQEQGIDVVILTGDRDTFQLISTQVRVDLAYSIQDRKIYDEAELAARYGGLTPAQQPDFKALLGDSSDNIPGVPKIGEKRAITLLQEYYHLEGIYEHLEQVRPPSVKQSLAENRNLAFANRELMTINRNAPVEFAPESFRFGRYHRKSVVDLMTELEFFSVISRIPAPQVNMAAPGSGDPSHDSVTTLDTDYQTVQTEAQLEAMLAALQETGRFAFDTETTSTDPMRADLVGLSFAVAPGRAWYVPLGHKDGQQLPLDYALGKLRPLLESEEVAKCAHNANYDVMVLENQAIHCRNVDFDTMIAAHLLGKNALGLKNLALDMLGQEMTPITSLIGTGRKQVTFDQVAIAEAIPYAAADADMTGRICAVVREQVSNLGLADLMSEVEMPLVPVLVKMQRHGIKIDPDVLHRMARQLNQQMHEVEHQLYQTIGHTVNINSPLQLSDLLFKELGLPRTKRTRTGYSTDANSLESLKGMHDVVDSILEYRQISKLKSTYVDSLPEMVNPRTGRIHTSYNQTGSATGRISSSEPNLQNIPIRTELGRQVRKAFVAGDPDWLLFAADYSQIELRVLAHLSQAPELLEAFHKGEDIHAATGSLMFEVPIHQVTPDMRRIAKILNFGVIYGLSPHGIAQQTGFSREQGSKFIETYYTKYPGIWQYIEEVKRKTWETQYVETMLGRRRYVPDINSSNYNVRGAAERMAINMPIQGTAADIMKLAMVRVDKRLDEEKLQSHMLLQVHDELVFEVPRDEMDAIKQVCLEEMPSAMKLDVALKVETKWGPTWGDME